MMDTLKFPLVFNTGGLATLPENSREYFSQLISNIAQVRYGDLPLRPDVGVPDPTFETTGLMTPLISAIVSTIPEITVTTIVETDSLTDKTLPLGMRNVLIDFEVTNAIS